MAIVLIEMLIAAPLMAGPPAPVAVQGQATFQQDGSNWTITTATDKTIINWNSFNVAEGAQMHFAQPSAASSVMNRVLGSGASHINGLLTSNGSVYLFNPNGIVIGPAGIIRVADFVASTLSVSNAEFLAGGDMNFKGTSLASIENYGKIEAVGGDIYLIASHVVNKGVLTAPTGSANLVAGTDVLLTQDHNIFVRPSGLTDGAGIGVDNSGVVDAVLARLLADGNMYALAINNTGVVRATGSAIADGQVLLRGEGGSVVNSGYLAARTVGADGVSAGGEIQVLGGDIAITSGATIDASGDTGGGRILIGGDFMGANPAIPNARTTFIDSGASVAANALAAGDGGTVIVWSDEATTVHGAISALGAGGGSGGFVETSGYTVDVDGMDLTIGEGGTWLLDPPAVTINTILAAQIVTQLNSNTNCIVPNDVPGTAAPADGITVEADIIATPTGTPYLFLDAGDGIAINANIDIGAATLYLRAGDGVTQAPGTSVAAAKLWLGGSGVFNLTQPGNDFGIVHFVVNGVGNVVSIQDVNDITFGSVLGGVGRISVLGGEVHITTPNGHIFANGLFTPGTVTGYHALGHVEIVETALGTGSYILRIKNWNDPFDPTWSKSAAAVAAWVGLTLAELAALTPDVNTTGSAVLLEFGDLAGDMVGYEWNFETRNVFDDPAAAANDYSFVVIDPVGPGAPGAEVLADAVLALNDDSPVQDASGTSWQTYWTPDPVIKLLNGVDSYTVGFGVMNVDDTDGQSAVYLRNMYFAGHPRGFIFDRIFDHVEDFLHIRPDERVSTVGPQLLAPVLDETSTYFDESSQITDPRYFYQSVGSIYQIPR